MEVRPDFLSGLKDLEGFSYIILIYHFHRSQSFSLHVKPFLDDHHHGVFATRAPNRPNPIGISIVRLISIHGNTLHIEDVDILDGTPLLDIKPYVPEFDVRVPDSIGWLLGKVEKVGECKADERFGSHHLEEEST